jgi:hypothetical protein
MDWGGRRADSGGWAETDATIGPTWNNQVRHMMAHGSWLMAHGSWLMAHGAGRTASTAGHGMPTTEAPKVFAGRESDEVQAKAGDTWNGPWQEGNPATRGWERTPIKSGGRAG